MLFQHAGIQIRFLIEMNLKIEIETYNDISMHAVAAVAPNAFEHQIAVRAVQHLAHVAQLTIPREPPLHSEKKLIYWIAETLAFLSLGGTDERGSGLSRHQGTYVALITVLFCDVYQALYENTVDIDTYSASAGHPQILQTVRERKPTPGIELGIRNLRSRLAKMRPDQFGQ